MTVGSYCPMGVIDWLTVVSLGSVFHCSRIKINVWGCWALLCSHGLKSCQFFPPLSVCVDKIIDKHIDKLSGMLTLFSPDSSIDTVLVLSDNGWSINRSQERKVMYWVFKIAYSDMPQGLWLFCLKFDFHFSAYLILCHEKYFTIYLFNTCNSTVHTTNVCALQYCSFFVFVVKTSAHTVQSF